MDTKIVKTNVRIPTYIRYFISRVRVTNPDLNDHEWLAYYKDSPKMSRYLDEIYKNVDKDVEREKEEKEMFRDSMKYYYYFQTHGVKYKPEPVDDVGASPIHVAAAKGNESY